VAQINGERERQKKRKQGKATVERQVSGFVDCTSLEYGGGSSSDRSRKGGERSGACDGGGTGASGRTALDKA
jgi:hypothetical protein